ncbi:MAG: K(+)/H(+) antiporter [Candelina mexicana]|nr:MAG: K(+)/H(+) antiporter [Candelina mexicana]
MASSVASVVTTTVTKTAASVAASASSTMRAIPQGGILEGANPSHYDSKNPITIFIIQAGIIIIFCRLLHFPLSKLRQPRVIAEVVGGIILGPSVMGRIPGFTKAIFPVASMPTLTLAANVGLILFLFLVGLEVNVKMFLSNWKVAISVGAAGMALPFGLGCAIAWGLYNQFHDEPGTKPIAFGVFMLFIGVAMAITAFPVLCRILTELKLLSTPVGVIVLSAGVGNDVVGWILLALCVALVNAGTGLTALYVLLTSIAYILFLVYAIRPPFLWILKRSGSIQNGPTQSVVGLTLLMVLTSAFFTGIIGIHPIFGAFVVGLICPHDGGFAIKLTEKIEDLVSVLFLPLYFALSGLNTNLGLLDSGITWGYVVGVTSVAFFAKIIGGTLAARCCKLVWRESLTIGVLMSCKGLVELIVLNIGLSAKILSTRTFTIFVVMALLTTFATTPLTSALYPLWYQRKLESWKRGEIDWDGNRLTRDDNESEKDAVSLEKLQTAKVRRLLVYLRLDSLPSLFTFITLLGGDTRSTTTPKVHRSKAVTVAEGSLSEYASKSESIARRNKPLEVHGVRMLELTERTSTVMKVSEADEYTARDPVVNAFRTFGQLNNVAVSGNVAVVPGDLYADTLTGRASDLSSDLILIPWSETGNMNEGQSLLPDSTDLGFISGPHNQFIFDAFQKAACNTAIFVNRGFGGPAIEESKSLIRTASGLSLPSGREVASAPIADRSHHIFFPFFGGADDRVALRFVLQVAQNSNITSTIVEIDNFDANEAFSPTLPEPTASPTSPRRNSFSKASSPITTGTTASKREHDRAFFAQVRDSLPSTLSSRVVFESLRTTRSLADSIARATAEVGQSPKNAGDLIVVGRHSGSGEGYGHELTQMFGTAVRQERRKALGDVAEAMLEAGLKASVLVIQAGGKGLDA